MNYIFIDFENVQETDLDRIANKPVRVALVLGERHKSLPVKLVKLIQKYPAQVQLVETGLNGKNALDFVLAYEVSVASAKDPGGYFHIVSRDKGFDALIKHLKSKEIRAARHEALSEIPMLMKSEERHQHLTAHFKSKSTGLPKKRKGLEAQIQGLFGMTLPLEEMEKTIQKLLQEKLIVLGEKDDVAYPPASPHRASSLTSATVDASLPAIVERAFKTAGISRKQP